MLFTLGQVRPYNWFWELILCASCMYTWVMQLLLAPQMYIAMVTLVIAVRIQ